MNNMSSLPPSSLACTICSEFYKPIDEVLSTSCGHVFHHSCFQDWQTRSLTCPDCRSALPQTHRLYLHFEEHTLAERQLHQSKAELISKVAELERQLSESEANFINALEALSLKEEQVKQLNNELEFRKAQNQSYEHELNILKQNQIPGGIGMDICKSFTGLNITGVEKHLRDNTVDIPCLIDLFADDSAPSTESTNSNSEPEMIIAAEATKSIFATKFATDTTEIEIKHYIQEKLPNLSDITVFKFPAPSFRRVCSFRITVPASFYETIVQPSFWPDFTVVREFFERPPGASRPEIEHIEVTL